MIRFAFQNCSFKHLKLFWYLPQSPCIWKFYIFPNVFSEFRFYLLASLFRIFYYYNLIRIIYRNITFSYFNWRLITLQYGSGFCHTLTWISHWCTCVPNPEPTSHLPPHPIPQGHPSAPALSTLSHASNLDWLSVSHMIIYMFQCYSFKSSCSRLLPQSPKVCVSFAVLHKGSSLPSF